MTPAIVAAQRMHRTPRAAITFALAAAVLLALTGCESSQEKSAKLERAAKRAIQHAPKGLSISRPSSKVHAVTTSLVSTPEASAAIVELRNSSAVAQRDIPIAITVRDGRGASVYTNTAPGLSRQLTSAPLVPAHGSLVWIDDQVQSSGGTPKTVTAVVSEGSPAPGTPPHIAVVGAHLVNDPSNGLGAEATVVNHSRAEQQELVVFATALRGGKVVAAGRSVVPQLAAGGSATVQVFFVGNPTGAQLVMSAPASSMR